MRIDRCYCYQVPFKRLKGVAEATGADSVEALQAHVCFGNNCQLCHPYVRRMLKTGETVFEEVLEDDDADDGDAAL
ncbi:MAG: (2Fe-2S)-binding protein [Salinibacter sp.]